MELIVFRFYSFIDFKYMYVFACVFICAACMVSVRWSPVPWNWSYRQSLAALWVLMFKPRSYGRAARTLNCWAISRAHLGNLLSFFFFFFHCRANSLDIPKNLTITDIRNKTITVNYVDDTLSNYYGWMALLLDQETYSLQFEGPWMDRSLQVTPPIGVSLHTRGFSVLWWRNGL